MNLDELAFINFRNLENQVLKFEKGVNVFWGDNAAGKTNLLEAIYLVSNGKSFRTRTDHELLTWGQEEAKLSAQADNLLIELTLKTQSKKLLINKQDRRLAEIMGSFLTVLFTPADLALVNGPPETRRNFLDRLASNLNKQYLYQLISLNKIIRNRNFILYKISQGEKADLGVWDEQLSVAASFIWKARLALIEQLGEKIKDLGKRLLHGSLMIEYVPGSKIGDGAKIKEDYLKNLQKSRGEDLQKKQTGQGPHRDNFNLILETEQDNKIVSKDLGIYGSRGEQRTGALVLKLAEVEILEAEKSTKPALLLDEVLSELDETHQELLLHQLYKGQSFITSTNLEVVKKILGKNIHSFKVVNGKVLKED